MPRRTDTRQRMLRTAANLFRAKGYHATGLNQVLADGSAPKGSLYFHFPGGKEQLAAEAVRRSANDMSERIGAALEQAATAADAIALAAAHLAERLVETDYAAGCPIATVALEAAATSEPVRDSCRAGYQSWIDRLTDRLRAEGHADDTAAGMAVTVVSGLEGALLLARVGRDTTPLNTVTAHMRTLIETPAS